MINVNLSIGPTDEEAPHSVSEVKGSLADAMANAATAWGIEHQVEVFVDVTIQSHSYTVTD